MFGEDTGMVASQCCPSWFSSHFPPPVLVEHILFSWNENPLARRVQSMQLCG